tara:strand:+ start:377 stop:637 length:261 start_codon:yes stop_codon:yes gene_type:complete
VTERSDARFATIQAYRSKVCGGAKLASGEPLIGNAKILYEGEFKYMDVARSVDVPGSASLGDHQAQWQKLYRLFDEEWSLYEHVSR